jgi:hypothetical protein
MMVMMFHMENNMKMMVVDNRHSNSKQHYLIIEKAMIDRIQV